MCMAQSCPTLMTPWTVAGQAPLSMGFSRQEYWSGLPFPPPGDVPSPGELLATEPPGKPTGLVGCTTYRVRSATWPGSLLIQSLVLRPNLWVYLSDPLLDGLTRSPECCCPLSWSVSERVISFPMSEFWLLLMCVLAPEWVPRSRRQIILRCNGKVITHRQRLTTAPFESPDETLVIECLCVATHLLGYYMKPQVLDGNLRHRAGCERRRLTGWPMRTQVRVKGRRGCVCRTSHGR